MSKINCPNCGEPDFDDKVENYHCKACRYKEIKSKNVGEATLIFCTGCGCSYLDKCAVHGNDFTVAVKIDIVLKKEPEPPPQDDD